LIVVSDTSPILNLSLIGRLDILARLYQQVLIPPAVHRELTRVDAGPPLIDLVVSPWLKVESVANASRVAQLGAGLDPGEAEAIALALEKQADMILIDERLARRTASRLGLRVIGLLGVLAESRRAGLIERVKPVIVELQERAGFWISDDLIIAALTDLGET